MKATDRILSLPEYSYSEDIGRGEYTELRVCKRPLRDGTYYVCWGKNWEHEARVRYVALRHYTYRGQWVIGMQRPNTHNPLLAECIDLFLGGVPAERGV